MADVFANYRKNSNKSFGIDRLYCISSPGFSDRAMLKMTGIEIHLMTDLNMSLIVEKGIRGGRCELIYYSATANNKYIHPNFHKNTDIKLITLV